MALPTPVVNLQKLWENKKRNFEYTQNKACKELGWTQGAFSQYLNNLTNLNDAAIIKLANFLDVDPAEIDPDFEQRAGVRWKRLPKTLSLTGLQDPPNKARYFDNSMLTHAQLIYCDVDLIPIACKGSYLVVCHERHINMQTRLSNMQHDLFGLYQEYNDGPWLCSPYVEIPDDIPLEQKRIVVSTLWI